MRNDQQQPQPQSDGMAGMIQQFGETLGLHPTFVKDVMARGEVAIIERAQTVDQTGAHARLLAMTQAYGEFLTNIEVEGQQVPPGAKVDAMRMIGEHFSVPVRVAVELLGAVDEFFEHTVRTILSSQPEQEASDANRA